MEKDDVEAIRVIGSYHRDGLHGFPQDYGKALELYHRAAKLGHANAYNDIGNAYDNGEGVGIDKKKATYYYELAAMKGDVCARYNLSIKEKTEGNFDRSLKHFMIAVICGDAPSLLEIKELYSNGHATKEDYTKALQLYQAYLGKIKSDQRDKAAAADEKYRYY